MSDDEWMTSEVRQAMRVMHILNVLTPEQQHELFLDSFPQMEKFPASHEISHAHVLKCAQAVHQREETIGARFADDKLYTQCLAEGRMLTQRGKPAEPMTRH